MTDKQIIVDGVDVSGCEYFKENDSCKNTCNYFCTPCEWVEIQNCMYKYAKRKEQECEELKKQNDCNCLDSCCKKQKLDQLKAENEELSTINARLLGRLEVDETDASLVFNLDKELRQKEKEFYTAIQKVVKLKQTLAEIKEIAERGLNCSQCSCGAKADLDLILQKINEVMDD